MPQASAWATWVTELDDCGALPVFVRLGVRRGPGLGTRLLVWLRCRPCFRSVVVLWLRLWTRLGLRPAVGLLRPWLRLRLEGAIDLGRRVRLPAGAVAVLSL